MKANAVLRSKYQIIINSIYYINNNNTHNTHTFFLASLPSEEIGGDDGDGGSGNVKVGDGFIPVRIGIAPAYRCCCSVL